MTMQNNLFKSFSARIRLGQHPVVVNCYTAQKLLFISFGCSFTGYHVLLVLVRHQICDHMELILFSIVITMLLLCNSTLLRANTKLCNQTRSGFLLYIWKSAVSLQILMKMHLPLRNDGGLVRLQRLLPRTSVSEISNALFVPTFFRSISASSRDTPKLDQS